jgi:hypothetical protein
VGRPEDGYRENAVVYVGCDRCTGGEVSYGALLHEFGHWRTANQQDPMYDDCFHLAE